MIYSVTVEPYGGVQCTIVKTDAGLKTSSAKNILGFNSQCYIVMEGDEILVYDEDSRFKYRRSVTNPVVVTEAGVIIQETGYPFIMDPFTGQRLKDIY